MESANFDENVESGKNAKLANNSKNGESGKNRQSVDENLNEASRGAPCKVVKFPKMVNLAKVSHGLAEYSN